MCDKFITLADFGRPVVCNPLAPSDLVSLLLRVVLVRQFVGRSVSRHYSASSTQGSKQQQKRALSRTGNKLLYFVCHQSCVGQTDPMRNNTISVLWCGLMDAPMKCIKNWNRHLLIQKCCFHLKIHIFLNLRIFEFLKLEWKISMKLAEKLSTNVFIQKKWMPACYHNKTNIR